MNNTENTFSVDLRTMADRTGKLNEELENLKRATAQLTEQLMVLKSLWSGTAADSFFQNTAADVQLIEDFTSASEKAAEDHAYALKIYNEIDQRSTDIAEAIRI